MVFASLNERNWWKYMSWERLEEERAVSDIRVATRRPDASDNYRRKKRECTIAHTKCRDPG
jgi:hypothetical protein